MVTFVIVAIFSYRFCGPNRNVFSLLRTKSDGPKISASPDSPPSHAVAKKGNPATDFITAYNTPIELYGKVVDQHGDPVVGATVMLLPFDNVGEESRSKMMLISDGDGKFSIKGLKGLAMGVQVTKDGYLTMSDLGFENPASSRRIEYGLDGTGGKQFKDPSNPVVFTLTKIGPLEPLFYMEQTRWRLPVDGSARGISLDSKDGIGPHQIEFRFTSKMNQLPERTSIYTPFDWIFEARIPGGGFLKNDSDYNFEAPETGYLETIKFDYPSTMPQGQWKRLRHGRYFVKFADGTFARIRFTIDAASDRRPLSMTSWINLKPGSRNLASLHKDNFGMPRE